MRSSPIEEYLLVLLKEVGRLKEFRPLRFTLKNLIRDAETYWKHIVKRDRDVHFWQKYYSIFAEKYSNDNNNNQEPPTHTRISYTQ